VSDINIYDWKQFDEQDNADDVYPLIQIWRASEHVAGLENVDIAWLLVFIDICKTGLFAKTVREALTVINTGEERSILEIVTAPDTGIIEIEERLKYPFRTRLLLERVSERLNSLAVFDALAALDESLADCGPGLGMLSQRDYHESAGGFYIDPEEWWGFRARPEFIAARDAVHDFLNKR